MAHLTLREQHHGAIVKCYTARVVYASFKSQEFGARDDL